MTNKMIRFGVFCTLFALLSGCSTTSTPQKSDHLPLANAVMSDAQQFSYLLQFSGGVYHSDPALTEYITAVGHRLARIAGYQQLQTEFFVVNSAVENAWVSPAGRVAVTRGMLLALENEAELAALLGHLLAHADHQHHQLSIQRDEAPDKLFLEKGAAHPYAQNMLEEGNSSLIAHAVRYSSKLEQQADREAIRMMVMAGYDPQAAVDLQLKSLGESREQSLWLRNHVSDNERLAGNRQAAHGQVKGLMLAEGSYQSAIALLKSDQAIYQHLSLAQQKLQQGQVESAYQALKMLLSTPASKHAGLHAMAAEVLLEQGEMGNSLAAYEQALSLNSGYYLYPLRRGELLMMEGETQLAEHSLLKSIELLPTAQAYLRLGELMESQAMLGRAHDYYSKAGHSDSEVGHLALKQAKRLDFAEHPNRYINIMYTRQDGDTLMLFISNINPYTVQLDSLLMSGERSYRVKLDKAIPAGQSVTSTVTIKGFGEVTGVKVDRAELIQ